mmetsp:Transcript_16433/g.24237  ORF Transcript_16433/g.24237 Transcript_16433/m.24237 type:complete len:442 (+) Transcript_16433:72-1397(+)
MAHNMEDVLTYLHRIGVLDDAFRSFFQEHPGAEDQQPPPTSAKALRQLPTISVKPEDLMDENNRECCICLEKNNVGDRVKRLPCAHIFHADCIMSWLKKTCTCPVCRYELETDNPHFERSRLERMRGRKARVHTYELDRMSVIELLAFARKNRINIPAHAPGSPDYKNLLIEIISNSDKIEIIADAPAPNVEYSLDQLRSMKVSELRKTMEDAGVFFDPVDVVEKEDMVRIFCNSGRFILVGQNSEQNTDSDEKPAYKPPTPPEAASHVLKQTNEQGHARRSPPPMASRIMPQPSTRRQKSSLSSSNSTIPPVRRNSTPRLLTRQRMPLRGSTPTSTNPGVATSQRSSTYEQPRQRRGVGVNNIIRNSSFAQNQGNLAQQRHARERQSRQTDGRRSSQKQAARTRYGMSDDSASESSYEWNRSDMPSEDSSSVSSDDSMWC